MKRSLIGGLTGVGLMAACALAGPLDKFRVDATAKWVVHVDVEAVMSSTTGKFIAEHRAHLDLGELEQFKEKTGLDAFRDIHDVTVYGMTDSPDEAVAVIRGTEKLAAAVEALVAEEESVEKVHLGGRSVYKWVEKGTERFGFLRKSGDGAGHERGGQAFVVSQRAENLERALNVMDGNGASLAGVREGPMAASPRKGSMVFAVVTELGKAAEHAPKVVRSAQQIRAELGEDDAGFFAELNLKAGSEEDIRNIADFGKGLLALGRMAISDEPEFKDVSQVIDGVTIEAKGRELTASFRIGRDLLNAALAEVKSKHDKEARPAIERTSKEKKR